MGAFVRRAWVVGLVLASACSRASTASSGQASSSARPVSVAIPSAIPSNVAPSAEARCITPESVGATPFGELEGASDKERRALSAARAELVRVLEDPSQFFASVQATDELVLLELWHQSAFLPQNCAVTGNPGGKCRTLAYDPKKARITSTKFWQ